MKRERWHGRGGGWVADAIYGANDGLGAVFGIVSGVAGATNNQQHFVLISGLAGMLASTLSMGAGAYLAAKSEAEVYEAEISREKAEVEENPEEEIEEMSLFYQLQGFSPEESQRMAERLAEQPEQLVQAMAQSELGLSEHHFPNPWKSATSAAISTAIGAFVPIIPFFFMGGLSAVIVAFRDQSDRTLRCRRREITHHHAFVVGVRFGNDVDRRHCRRRNLRARSRFWRCDLVFAPLRPQPMAEVKWAEILQIRKQRCDPFRKTPVSFDVETPFDYAMKANVLRKPFFPLLARHATHRDGAIFSFFQ